MASYPWANSFPGAITVCDTDGIILEMNDRSVESYREEGGAKLIGTNVLDCHPESARNELKEMLDTQRPYVYTITKHGKQELIYQTPWYQNGVYTGFLEMVIELPDNMPHFNRGG